jgi:chromosome segregation ATPase
MAEPPNQTLISVNQADWNNLQQTARAAQIQVQASADEIREQAVRISTLRAESKEKDMRLDEMRKAAEVIGRKAQDSEEDIARMKIDNEAFEEDNKRLNAELKKKTSEITRLKKKIEKLEKGK